MFVSWDLAIFGSGKQRKIFVQKHRFRPQPDSPFQLHFTFPRTLVTLLYSQPHTSTHTATSPQTFYSKHSTPASQTKPQASLTTGPGWPHRRAQHYLTLIKKANKKRSTFLMWRATGGTNLHVNMHANVQACGCDSVHAAFPTERLRNAAKIKKKWFSSSRASRFLKIPKSQNPKGPIMGGGPLWGGQKKGEQKGQLFWCGGPLDAQFCM